MSRTAAPVGEVTSAMEDGQAGIGFLCASANRPSACSFASRVRTPGFRSTVSYSWAITSRITS